MFYVAIWPNTLSSGEEFDFPFSLIPLAAGLGQVLALVLLGTAILRAKAILPIWRGLPLLLGLLYMPALGIGGALASLDERYLEIPLVFLALGWMLLGYALWAAGQSRTTRERDQVGA